MLEQGYPQYRFATSWYGAFVPSSTPESIRKKLEAMFTKASNSPDLVNKLASSGLEVVGGPGSMATQRIKEERTYWEPVVKASGLVLE